MLGLGSQVKPHIERRFSMPWSHPAPRMRELVLAMRAIWRTWQDGEPLDFRGDFYTHTLMTPFFSPAAPRVGPAARLPGRRRRADDRDRRRGVRRLLLPPVHHRPLPARGDAAGAPQRGAPPPATPTSTVSPSPARRSRAPGATKRELATAIKGTKDQIAFYASTPAYRPVLDLHGWGDLQPELTRLSKEGRWSEMGDAIDDELLHAFAVVGEPGRGRPRVAGAVGRRGHPGHALRHLRRRSGRVAGGDRGAARETVW